MAPRSQFWGALLGGSITNAKRRHVRYGRFEHMVDKFYLYIMIGRYQKISYC